VTRAPITNQLSTRNKMNKNQESNAGRTAALVVTSDLLADSGLEPLLRYIANPSEYIRKHRDVPECSDAQRSDWDAWARSRAGFIHRKLFPANAKMRDGEPSKPNTNTKDNE
jgi:hypothetical protein